MNGSFCIFLYFYDLEGRPECSTSKFLFHFQGLKYEIISATLPFRFVYKTADIFALSRSLDSVDIYISCWVHNCEWHSIYSLFQYQNTV